MRVSTALILTLGNIAYILTTNLYLYIINNKNI